MPCLTALHELSEACFAYDGTDMERICHLKASEDVMALLPWQEVYLSPRLPGEAAEAPAEGRAHTHFKLR